jgi:hypothetical protein
MSWSSGPSNENTRHSGASRSSEAAGEQPGPAADRIRHSAAGAGMLNGLIVYSGS